MLIHYSLLQYINSDRRVIVFRNTIYFHVCINLFNGDNYDLHPRGYSASIDCAPISQMTHLCPVLLMRGK